MLTNGVKLGAVALFLITLLGCRQTAPEVKPRDMREELAVPPAADPRFSNPVYPKQAFQDRDASPLRKLEPIMPAKGPGMTGPGGPGTPLYR